MAAPISREALYAPVVSDDFRVVVRLAEAGKNTHLVSALSEHEVEEDVRKRLGDRVAVSDDGDVVFLYSDTEDAGREAQRIVNDLMHAHGMDGEVELERWHHEEEEWEDAGVPMPSTPEEHQMEHERLEQEETAESEASGIAEWEVRIELASHHDAHALAQQLEQEGFANIVRRWKYLLIGTNDQDDAEALAKRLQNELPRGATVHVESGSGLAWEVMPRNPFAVFGGLGG
jgi:hypothetical protein